MNQSKLPRNEIKFSIFLEELRFVEEYCSKNSMNFNDFFHLLIMEFKKNLSKNTSQLDMFEKKENEVPCKSDSNDTSEEKENVAPEARVKRKYTKRNS